VSESVPLTGLSGRCVVTYDHEPQFDAVSCAELLQPVMRDLLGRALIAKSSTYTVRIDMPG
jgi:hypothetical protein